MGDSKRRREAGGPGADDLAHALAAEARLNRILDLPEFEVKAILKDIPGIIDSFAPTVPGAEYDQARTWHRLVREAVQKRVDRWHPDHGVTS